METRLINNKMDSSNLFDDTYINSKNLYLQLFGKIPQLNYVNRIDGEKSFNVIKEKYKEDIVDILQYKWYRQEKKAYQFDQTVVIFGKGMILELDTNYCEIYYDHDHVALAQEITELLQKHKERQRRQPLEINLIVKSRNSLELRAMEINRTKLDIDLFYEDDFKEVDQTIRNRLNRNKDKGIVLLHGLPGTGKTTYLRWLVGKIKKRVLFLSPSIAEDIMSPELIQLLIGNSNSVVIIEDAENIIMDRRTSGNSTVSNLLNISDGLLADFLNVQLVCTFNSSLTSVDQALLRKGRLIAKYEFGKLGIAKAQALSNHLGQSIVINKPMTVAEIANPEEKDHSRVGRVEVIGFRQREILEN
jgi:SpoVK/Ycf46/Vps4 family AAA+-type ATPase